MFTLDQPTFQLDNFEGPLEFLLHLVQKHEIDLEDVPLKAITHQFLRLLQEEGLNVDSGAEFVTTTASLLLLKSKLLLPPDEGEAEVFEGDDPRFNIIHQLLDYCRFKDAAKGLAHLEDQQQGVFFRGAPEIEVKKPSGVAHLSVDDLALAFQDLLKRAEANKGGLIHEEEWRVSDKIRWIRKLLDERESATLQDLFPLTNSKGELIVTFLAVLELMKEGFLEILKAPETQEILILPRSEA